MLFIVVIEKICKVLLNVIELGCSDYLFVVIGRILMRILVFVIEFVFVVYSYYLNWYEFLVDDLIFRLCGVIIGVRFML